MYRFHPSVKWSAGYPDRQQIVSQITQLWKRYGLQERTKFNTTVTSVTQDKEGRWIVNDPSNGRFDGVMAAVGSCGDPKIPHMPGQENFKGEIYHSSKLDGKTAQGKKVLIIGGGASAVEALEFVVHTGAKSTSVLARSEKWIIPRNAFVDTLLAFNIFGQETIFSWIPETLLRIFFYRDLDDLAPQSQGLFTETPMVNVSLRHPGVPVSSLTSFSPTSFTRSVQVRLNGFVVTFLVSLRTAYASITARKEFLRVGQAEKASWMETWLSWRLASRDLVWHSCRMKFLKSLTRPRTGIFKVMFTNRNTQKLY